MSRIQNPILVWRPLLVFLFSFGQINAVNSHKTWVEELDALDEAQMRPMTSTRAGLRVRGSLSSSDAINRRLDASSTTDFYSWERFETSWTRKKKHSEDEEDCWHLLEKHGITCAPSQNPSSMPSVAPTVSAAPSTSVAPSRQPSFHPTRAPTETPSARPTGVPSVSPTFAPTEQPSVSPTNYPTTLSPTVTPFTSLVLTREDGSMWQEDTCQTSLPVGASLPQGDETLFEYFLQVTAGSNVEVSIQQVEQALANTMAEEVLNCNFQQSAVTISRSNNGGGSFEIYGISSLPVDVVRTNSVCPEDFQHGGAGDVDCYSITAGFTPTIFYLQNTGSRRHRHLKQATGRSDTNRDLKFNSALSSGSESEVFQFFGPLLQRLLDNTTLVSGDVVATKYSGFLVGEWSGSTTSGSGLGTDTLVTGTSAIQGNAAASGSGGNKKQSYVIGGIVVCLASIALLVVAAVLVQKRKVALRNSSFEKCDESSAAELDLEEEDNNGKYDTGSIQEGFPGDNTRYNHQQGIEVQNNEDYAAADNKEPPRRRGKSWASKHFALADDIDESSVEAERQVKGLKYLVVNDEATIDDSLLELDSSAGNDPHDYTNCRSETCFKCRSKRLPQPTFVQADLHAIQHELGSNKKYQPRYNRQYHARDTVDL